MKNGSCVRRTGLGYIPAPSGLPPSGGWGKIGCPHPPCACLGRHFVPAAGERAKPEVPACTGKTEKACRGGDPPPDSLRAALQSGALGWEQSGTLTAGLRQQGGEARIVFARRMGSKEGIRF